VKGLLKRFLYYTIALFIATQLLAGFKLHGGLQVYIITGIILSLMMLILKPVLHFLSMPLNIITFGLSSFLVNVVILFLLTVFVAQVTVGPFTLPGISLLGISVVPIALNKWFAYLVASFVVFGVYSLLLWIQSE
jgi:putative membrane protein